MRQPVYVFGDFQLNPATRELRRGDERVVLPLRVFNCLQYLIEHRDQAVSREELIQAVWHHDNISDVRLGQLVLRARRAIGDYGAHPSQIRTIIGFGYHWITPIGLIEAEPATPATPATEGAGESLPGEKGVIASTTQVPGQQSTVSPANVGAPSRRRWIAIAALATMLATLAVIASGWLHRTTAPATASPIRNAVALRVAVLPLKAPPGAESAWIHFGGMDFIAERLRDSGIAVVPSETTLTVLGNSAREPSDAAPKMLRQHAGVSLVIEGELVRESAGWRVHLDSGDAANLRAEGSGADPMIALRHAADVLIVHMGRAPSDPTLAPDVAEIVQRVRSALLADDPTQAQQVLDGITDANLRDAAEIRLASAQVLARAGRYDEADRALTQLLAGLVEGDSPRLRMSTLTLRAVSRTRVGRLDEARRDADTAITVPTAENYASEYAAALNARAIAATALRDFDAAGSGFGQARLQFERIGDALGVARVDNNLGLLDYERGALSEADRQFEKSLSAFDAFGAVRELSSALGGRMLVLSAQLRHAEALATSDRFWPQIERTADPLQKRANLLRRAEALMTVGRLADSRAVLARIHAADVPNAVETRDAERLALLDTELALREGRDEDATRFAAPLPTEPPSTGDDDLRARSALVRQRALGAVDDNPDADGRALDAIAAATPTRASPLRALAIAERSVSHRHTDLAGRAYRVALQQAEASGAPRLIAEVIESSAPWLIDSGHLAEAAAQVGRVSVWADRDFDCALLQLRLAHAQGNAEFERDALANAERIAGERRIPLKLPAVANRTDAQPRPI